MWAKLNEGKEAEQNVEPTGSCKEALLRGMPAAQGEAMVTRWYECGATLAPTRTLRQPLAELEQRGEEVSSTGRELRRVLVAGRTAWRGAAVLAGDPDDPELQTEQANGWVLVEYLRCGNTEWVPWARVKPWDPQLRDSPHGLDDEQPDGVRGAGTGPDALGGTRV